MSHGGGGGGGAEAHARFKQYEYRANAGLVLTTDSRPRDTHEPSGEPESLFGKIDPRSFGDRVSKGRPSELDEKIQRARKKKEREPLDSESNRQSKKRRKIQEESVLTTAEEGDYRPKTKETRAAYEAMLNMIQQQLGGQPLNIVCGAADEILALLKNDNFKPRQEKGNREVVESHIHPGDGAEALNDDVGVAVEFEENEEEEDEESDLDVVPEDEEEDDDVQANGVGAMQMSGGIDDDEMQEPDEGMALNEQDIDAYWLQRKISQAYEQQIDPQQSQILAEEVLKILAEGDDHEVETKLLVHLQFEKFSLIKYLLRSRLKVVRCTRLARAEDQEKRKKIEEEMSGLGPDHAAILEQLHPTRATAKERQNYLEKSIGEEARRLKDETRADSDVKRKGHADRDLDNGWSMGQRQLLNLDSLAVCQAGLFKANGKGQLPERSYKSHMKGYEEVHVQRLMPKPLAPGEALVKISSLPEWAQPAFSGMAQLNRVQ
ncbi:DExH-box ATP-dependent RNA helicase DExH12 [Datura stramonium]|uniref:DExH-box ATP-dependent RNA helicase DExH12 n=1 Tax=Datura stramonium TaxID=4076 RepID=A0ABS8T855_DATST|nr:DExH-box ATP-dependent RNA helicase DExH12 [Datura stramonium]